MFNNLVRFGRNNVVSLSVVAVSASLYILYKKGYLKVPNFSEKDKGDK